MTIARWGIPTLIGAALFFALVVFALPDGLARGIGLIVVTLLWLFVLAFFRNPRRTPRGGPHALIAPADGVVADITTLDEPSFLGGPAVRIGIFLSVFDVHVNRSPIAARIAYVHYRPGKFLDARHPSVAHENEANTLGLTVDPAIAPGVKLLLRQLSGLIARRIVCTHGLGDALGQGELYGMIRFGSRTELWIPVAVAAELRVRVGDRVRCGETVLAELAAPARPGTEPAQAPSSATPA